MSNFSIVVFIVAILISLTAITIFDKNAENKNNVDTQTTELVDDSSTSSDTHVPQIESSATFETSKVHSNVVLDLSGQGLSKAPTYIFDRDDLEELNLSNNNLTGALQAEVRHLINLKVLNLSNNQFTGVPAEIGQLKNLEILDLSNNNLTGLPYELGNLSNLKVLNLKGNNYSVSDLNIIKANLSSGVIIQVD